MLLNLEQIMIFIDNSSINLKFYLVDEFCIIPSHIIVLYAIVYKYKKQLNKIEG